MSIVKAIYNAPIVLYDYVDKNFVVVEIKYNGRKYQGMALLNPHDEDFFSPKVGKNIALSRARINAMKAELKRETESWNIKSNFYEEVIANGGNPLSRDEEVSLKCETNLYVQEKRIKYLRAALKREESNLNKYLQGQAKAIESVRRFRAKQDSSN